jgi:hypothetical protein
VHQPIAAQHHNVQRAKHHGKLSLPNTVTRTGNSCSTLLRGDDEGGAEELDKEDDEADDNTNLEDWRASSSSSRKIACRRGISLFEFM